jgi:hypothetical protein
MLLACFRKRFRSGWLICYRKGGAVGYNEKTLRTKEGEGSKKSD